MGRLRMQKLNSLRVSTYIFVLAASMLLVSLTNNNRAFASTDYEQIDLQDEYDQFEYMQEPVVISEKQSHDLDDLPDTHHMDDAMNDAHGSHHDAAHSNTAGHEDGHAKSEGLPQFNPKYFPSQLFWLFVCFAFLYVFFSKKTLPEISSVLENRRNHIQSDLEQAESLRSQAEETQRIYENGLESARKESAQIIYDLHEEIQETAQHKNEFFIEKSKLSIQELEDKLQKAKKETMEEMNTIAAEIASAAAEQIVGIATNLDDAKTVVEALSNSKKAA